MFGERILLCAHGAAVGQRADFVNDPGNRPGTFALLVEVRIFGDARRIQNQQHTVAPRQIPDRAKIFERDTGWPPAMFTVVARLT